MATRVTNTGKLGVTLPAPYAFMLKGGASRIVAGTVPFVSEELRQSMAAGQYKLLSFAVSQDSASTAAPAKTSTASSGVAGQTRFANLSAQALRLPAPYYTEVPAGGTVVLTAPIAEVVARLAALPTYQQKLWQASVVTTTPQTSAPVASTVAPLDFGGGRGVNAADPKSPQDIATKAYVDTAIAAIPAPTAPLSLTGDAANSGNAVTVVGIQGRSISATAPEIDQLLGWDGAEWTPVPRGTSGAGDQTMTFPLAGVLHAGDCVALNHEGHAQLAGALLAIGIAESVSATTVSVRLSGALSAFSGLVPGSPYFVGSNGRPSSTPSLARVQHIGVALTPTTLLVSPNLTTVRRSA